MKIKRIVMNFRDRLKKQPVMFYFAVIIFVVSLFMLGLYFGHINGQFSSDSKDWSNFGDYFGSITGLLAFAAVLFTAALSEKRALKAEEESITREERDHFFKLLELIREQSHEISFNPKDPSKDKLENFITTVERQVFTYLIKYFVENITQDEWEAFRMKNDPSINKELANYYDIGQEVISIMHRLNPKNNLQAEHYNVKHNHSEIINLKAIQSKKIKFREYRNLVNPIFEKIKDLNRKDLDFLFENISGGLTPKICCDSIEYISELSYSSVSKRNKYCQTVITAINILNQFKSSEVENFRNILRSQICNNEVILLLIFILTSYSDKTSTISVLKFNIFSNLSYKYFILVNSEKYKGKEGEVMSSILKCYIEKMKYN